MFVNKPAVGADADLPLLLHVQFAIYHGVTARPLCTQCVPTFTLRLTLFDLSECHPCDFFKESYHGSRVLQYPSGGKH